MSRTKILLLFSILFFGTLGCSYVPDWANPIEFYKNASDWITDPQKVEDEVNKKTKTMIPGSDKSFPKLVNVPSRPVRLSSTERTLILNSLISDRKKAKETESKLKHHVNKNPVLEKKSNLPATQSVEGGQKSPPNDLKLKTVTPLTNQNLPKKVNLDKVDKRVLEIIRKGQPVPKFNGKRVEQLTQLVEKSTHTSISEIGISKRGSFINSDIIVATLLFPNGSAQLTKSHRKEIYRIVSKFRGKKGIFHIIGHASSRTRNLEHVRHKMTNLNLSYERARVVSRELIRQGIFDSLVQVTGVSDSQPVYTEVVPLGEAGNRRVEIIFEKNERL